MIPWSLIMMILSQISHSKKSLQFMVSARVSSDPSVAGIFLFYLFLLLWNDVTIVAKIAGIDWNSACSHRGIWTFAWFVRPLLIATILCVWEIWSGSNNRGYMHHVFHWGKTSIKLLLLLLIYFFSWLQLKEIKMFSL